MVKRHHHELDKDAKGAVNHERKFLKHLDQEQDGKMKEFLNKQKKEYKMKKEQMKEVRFYLFGKKQNATVEGNL